MSEEEANRRKGEEGFGEEERNKEEEKKRMKVLIAIDESSGSFYALEWALNNLFFLLSSSSSSSTVHQEEEEEKEKEKGSVSVILLHVQQPFQPFIIPAGPGITLYSIYATPAVMESVRKTQEQNSAVLLARALEICKGKGIKVETMILCGDPKDMICQAAEQTHSDLLVVGSRGLGKIKRAFLGSVSDYCAHHAKCPILIVKPPK